MLGNSLSVFKSPSYNIDQFPFFQDGTTSASYVYADYFNTLASCINATEAFANLVSGSVTGSYTIPTNVYFESGVNYPPVSGQYLNNTAKVHYVYGSKSYSSTQADYLGYGSAQRNSPTSSNGPLSVSTNGVPGNVVPSFNATGWEPWPGWYGPDLAQNRVTAPRLIIGSSRADVFGVQRRPNEQCARNTSNVSSGQYGYYDNIGTGGLFANGTFWVPEGQSSWVCAPGNNFAPWNAVPGAGIYYAHIVIFSST